MPAVPPVSAAVLEHDELLAVVNSMGGHAEFLLKERRHRHQRNGLIRLANRRKFAAPFDIHCPDAVQFCRRVTQNELNEAIDHR